MQWLQPSFVLVLEAPPNSAIGFEFRAKLIWNSSIKEKKPEVTFQFRDRVHLRKGGVDRDRRTFWHWQGRLVDGAVESFGRACFSACVDPRNRTTSCYQACYQAALLGNTSASSAAGGMSAAQIVAPWEQAFHAVAAGGCPDLKPTSLEIPRARVI